MLCSAHKLPQEELWKAMTAMRVGGVRRVNACKNTGHAKFAFSPLQLKLLPDMYRYRRHISNIMRETGHRYCFRFISLRCSQILITEFPRTLAIYARQRMSRSMPMRMQEETMGCCPTMGRT